MQAKAKNKLLKFTFADGWKGLIVEKWANMPFEPQQLSEQPEIVFKSDGKNTTGVKTICCGEEKFSFVVKKIGRCRGVKAILDVCRGSRSKRSLKFALKLQSRGVDCAEPIAAFWKKGGRENIFLTGYISGSMSLYDAAFGKNEEILKDLSARKAVIEQTAKTLAVLFKAGFWHRDGKAGNFIVHKDENGCWKILLIDLDGIKRNLVCPQKNIVRSLAKLAGTLSRFKAVSRTDLYRGFCAVCRHMDFDMSLRRVLLKRVERLTAAYCLAVVVGDLYKEI